MECCRGGWRASVAAQSVKKTAKRWCLGRQCGDVAGHTDCEHWRELKSYLIGLASSDQAYRVSTLNSLAAFLLCVSSGDEAASSAHDYAVSVLVGKSTVFISHQDVIHLYDVLFEELAKLSSYLLMDLWLRHDGECSSVQGDSLYQLQSEVYAQTLCCCIRIIPVVDMFNTSLSHSASLAVNEVLHQLCSFSNIFPVGGPNTPKEHHYIVIRGVLLEVFLNEILLHQDLTCPFLNEHEDCANLMLERSERLAIDVQSQASIEAAFAHMLHHHLLKGHASAFPARSQQAQVSKLSLPAGVLLLDLSTVNEVPNGFLTHIMSLVAGALLPLDVIHESDGAAYGSSVPRRINGDDINFEFEELPHGVAIGLASSVVETAMGLLSKHYSASVPVISRDNDGIKYARNHHTELHGRSTVSDAKYTEYTSFLAALLRAIACAIIRIVREVSQIKYNASLSNKTDLTIGTCGGFEEETLELAIKRILGSVAGAFSFNLPSVRFMEVVGCFEHTMVETLASENTGGVIGWTLVLFAHILCYESQRGLEEVLAGEYLHVLDSLVGLLFLENGCRIDGNNNSGLLDFSSGFLGLSAVAVTNTTISQHAAAEGRVPHAANSTNFFLHAMLKSLQRTAWDLQSNKKPTSRLLSFISRVTPIPESIDTVSENGNCMAADGISEQDAGEPPDPFGSSIASKPRASTLAIVKRLQQKQHQIPLEGPDASCITTLERVETVSCRERKRTRSSNIKSNSEETTTDRNPYVVEMLTKGKYEESFDDLSDFIVCKKGRNYSKFINARVRYRRRNHTRLIWKRREEKRNLLRLLDLSEKQAGLI